MTLGCCCNADERRLGFVEGRFVRLFVGDSMDCIAWYVHRMLVFYISFYDGRLSLNLPAQCGAWIQSRQESAASSTSSFDIEAKIRYHL